MCMRVVLPILALVCILSSCKKFVQFHPNEVRPDEIDINAKNIARINNLPERDTFRFILTGDTQRFYDQVEAFAGHVNTLRDISFVIINGDLVDFGLNSEYNMLVPKLNKMNVPYVAVMGNHDMLANGKQIFNKMFGPENFTFSYSGTSFICFNSNSREANFNGSIPDLNFLQQEINNTSHANNLMFVSHVPPNSGDFDRNLEQRYNNLVSHAPHARMSLHAHEHRYVEDTPYEDGFPYLIVGSYQNRNYALITVAGNSVTVEEKRY